MPLALIPLCPLIVFTLLGLNGGKVPTLLAPFLGVLGILLSFVFVLPVVNEAGYSEILWTWIPFYASQFDTATVQVGFYLDSLSALMCLVVSFVSLLIAIFSVSFMKDDPNIAWFFACMNLFVAFMLILVLADNLLLLFLGWEGVGLCSYLLIGFWRDDVQNGQAAMKAFITTRIGDVFLLFAIFLIFSNLGTLNIQEVLDLVSTNWPIGSLIATCTALCLLGGAVGKSAQFPLQVWLADAMRGPTPVSALIHAATMVTAGVYLIARMGSIFALSPFAQMAVLWIGAFTLVTAGIAALLQNDIKRVLAYSTMSQLGYMFLALGAGAYSAAIFHLATHAFFKALLFLGAGLIGHLMHHEYSLLRVGNLKFTSPLLFSVFLIGLASLIAIPSKELILNQVFNSSQAGVIFWAIGSFGALLTGAYASRLFFLIFFKKAVNPIEPEAKSIGFNFKLSLIVLMILSVTAGFFPIARWVEPNLIRFVATESHMFWTELVPMLCGLVGIALGYFLFWPVPQKESIWAQNLGLDAAYECLLLRPYRTVSFFMKADPIRAVYRLVGIFASACHNLLALLQTGNLLHYVTALGVALIFLLGVWGLR